MSEGLTSKIYQSRFHSFPRAAAIVRSSDNVVDMEEKTAARFVSCFFTRLHTQSLQYCTLSPIITVPVSAGLSSSAFTFYSERTDRG